MNRQTSIFITNIIDIILGVFVLTIGIAVIISFFFVLGG